MLTYTLVTVLALAAPDLPREEKWPAEVFFGLHYDLHASPVDPDLGAATTYEHIRAELEKVRPDFVQYDCKGHGGWTGYPTEVGSPAPNIARDALKIWREVTRDLGIPLSVHYSGVWDNRAMELHPEWGRTQPDGQQSNQHAGALTGYLQDFMIPQMLEVVEKYDIDGFWVDGENWASSPSWSEACKAEFTRRTGITEIPNAAGEPHWDAWLAFHRDLFVEHVTAYTEALHAAKPEIAICSNWMYSVRQPDLVKAPVDYLSGDFDPSFGGERAMAEARFLDSQGLPWNLMAWTFLHTSDQQWTYKSSVHICQEVAAALAQGGAIFLYNQPQRNGHLTGWHQDIMAEVARFCRARQPFTHQTRTIPQIAVLHSQGYFYRHNPPLHGLHPGNVPMEGALQALVELGYSVDLLNEDMLLDRMDRYPVVVVPEQDGLPENLKEALAAYVQGGGKLLLAGHKVTAEFADLAGLKPVGDPMGTLYVPAGNGCAMTNVAWQPTELAGAETIAMGLWQQEPEVNQGSFAASTINTVGKGRCATITGDIFRAYYNAHYPLVRRFIGDALASLDADLIRMEGPWYIEMAAREKDGRMLLQFVNRNVGGYLSNHRHHVETVPDAGPFAVRVPMAERPTRCYMAPEVGSVEWDWDDGVLTARIAGLGIHNVLVIE